jgi:hypothetical protein
MFSEEKRPSQDRLTVSLAPGQREALTAIARHNNTTLAFVVRYAIAKFVEASRDRQLQLEFPEDQ